MLVLVMPLVFEIDRAQQAIEWEAQAGGVGCDAAGTAAGAASGAAVAKLAAGTRKVCALPVLASPGAAPPLSPSAPNASRQACSERLM